MTSQRVWLIELDGTDRVEFVDLESVATGDLALIDGKAYTVTRDMKDGLPVLVARRRWRALPP